MLSEAEVQGIVSDAATRLRLPIPRVSFVPARISFMPVLVMNGTVVVTPAARAALSPKAIQFAVLHGMASDAIGTVERPGLRWGIGILGLGIGVVASSAFGGAARFLVATVVTVLAIVALLFASASIRSKWPSRKIDRMVLSAVPNLDGAKEYVQTTDRFNLNGEAPEDWIEPHGRLIDLSRLEATAQTMGVSTA